MRSAPLLALLAFPATVLADAASAPPFTLSVHAREVDTAGVVQQVTVEVRSLARSDLVLITALEFDGQLPEMRPFYDGENGKIWREGGRYHRHVGQQNTTMPVASCVLPPGGSRSWKRPLRLDTPLRARVEWKVIPLEQAATRVHCQFVDSHNAIVDLDLLDPSRLPQLHQPYGPGGQDSGCVIESYAEIARQSAAISPALDGTSLPAPGRTWPCGQTLAVRYQGDDATLEIADGPGGLRSLTVPGTVADLLLLTLPPGEVATIRAYLDSGVFEDLAQRRIVPTRLGRGVRSDCDLDLSEEQIVDLLEAAPARGLAAVVSFHPYLRDLLLSFAPDGR